MGGVRNFSIEAKFFQLVVEEGGTFFELFEIDLYGEKSTSMVAVKLGANSVRL